MACGHVTTATMDGKPVCAVCYGRCDRAEIVVYECVSDTTGLESRKSKCRYCSNIVDSKWNLPFFEYNPDNEYDSHYDGCMGWN